MTPFRWLWSTHLRQQARRYAGALALMAVEGASLGIFAKMMKPMFDEVFVAGNQSALWLVGLVVLGVFVLRAVSTIGQRVCLVGANERVAARLRQSLLSHLMSLEVAFHQSNPPGALIERVQGDVTAMIAQLGTILTGLGRDLISVIVLFGVALSVDWRWTLIALVGIPLLMAPALLAQRYVRGRAAAARAVAAKMSTRLDEVFHGIAQVKLGGLERYQARRYQGLNSEKIEAETRAASGQSAIPALIDIMTGIGFLGVLYYGGGEIMDGQKSVGDFMSFFTAMALTFEPMRRLGNISGLWQAASVSAARLKTLIETRPAITEPARPTPPPPGAVEIKVEGASLAFGDMPALAGLTFTAEAGKTTALVGASGAGKSTVFNMLTRLVDPQHGAVTIGGIETRAMALAELRGLFSVVTQEALLFDETIAENILLGQEVPEARLAEVLAAAHVADFLPNLPAGLDSPAGPRGSALSGGQRQRIAIARALLRDRPILLLDEATSALDARSEAIIQTAFDRLAQGRTVLVIAHRLATIRAADKIVVMDKGRVVEQGGHDALMARGGVYAELCRLQFSGGTA